jgi:polar amino acid transport system substrate-binding protein
MLDPAFAGATFSGGRCANPLQVDVLDLIATLVSRGSGCDAARSGGPPRKDSAVSCLFLRILLPLSLLALSACQSLSLGGGSRLDHILATGELRVGLSASQPPLNMKTRSGEIIGLEVDLVSALANSMGLSVRIVERPFAELLDAIEANEVDMVISGITITPERNARVAFVGPYFISGKSLLTKSSTISRVDDPESLDDGERRYAALEGSTSATFVREVAPNATLVETADYASAVAMVMNDEVHALVADFPICEVSMLRHPEAGLSTLTTPFTVEPLGIALPADDPLLVNLVANYLTTLENTGMLTQLKARWFSYGDWVAELP